MVPKRIRLLALLAPFFLVACTLSQNNGVSKNMPAQQGNDLLSMASPAGRYAVVIQRAVEKKMYQPDAWRGKVCTVRMSLRRDGVVENAVAESGDARLCKMALSAVKRAEIPPAPDEATWKLFRNAPLEFRL
ncbi:MULTISPECIES: cell envelope integrity protein TolA [Pantoea]|jgi:colicin import membrane protein|uniref:cell envelope integrity protein TolA n=1 Tax=Pantoea TaxID=53335 RepID=UPI001F2E1E5A|nr:MULTISPECIES: cell envelope integrity protein TolA [Pantoea]UIL54400.1 cell envelope integrity protein TolA [Pantoea agglomerans]